MTVTQSTTTPNAAAVPTDACAICGATDWSPHLAGLVDHLTGDKFDIDRCGKCGVLTTRPPPPLEQVEQYYPARYRGNRHSITGGLRDRLRGRAIESCFPAGFRGRLLDVGCGQGTFAQHMRDRGWTVAATEIDGATVQRLRAERIDAKLPSDAEAAGFDGGPFDAITCWHVLEHVVDPAHLAGWVQSQLAPNGAFQATVPNVECWQARFFGRRWMHLDVPRHRHHFTPDTLAALLIGAGLKPGRRANVAWEYDGFGIVQSTLDAVCSRPSVLFDRLTAAPDAGKASTRDLVLSFALAGPLALWAGPAVAIGWATGDGATLTITCGG